ncbi:hypothetical protein [Dokdonella soli]
MNGNVRLVLGLALLAIVLVGCDRLPSLLLGFNDHRIVLSDKPIVLDTKPTRLSTDGSIKVLGVTTDLCVTLSNDAKDATDAKDVNDFNAEYAKLKGGAHLLAVLHARDGKDYEWKCGGWSFSPNGAGRGTMYSCLKWECNQSPPKGTEIASIDLSSDRPLRVLGAHWSSTDAFDHVSQPPPDPVAVPSAEYKDLERSFGGQSAWPSTEKLALQVTLSSNHGQISLSHFNSTLSLRMSDSGIQLQPTSNAVGMSVVTIPTSAIESCSVSCFSNLARETDLLLPGSGIQLGVLNTPELIDWCWSQHLPMATSASSRAWLYKGTPLPPKDSYTAQFESRAAYDHQAHQSCMGY